MFFGRRRAVVTRRRGEEGDFLGRRVLREKRRGGGERCLFGRGREELVCFLGVFFWEGGGGIFFETEEGRGRVGATPALVVATRAADRHGCPRHGPSVETRREEEVEVELETHAGQRAQTTPPLGAQPAPLFEVAGPQAAVTVGYVAAAVLCLTPVVMEQEAAQDDSTVAWLLARSLAEAAELDHLDVQLREVDLELIREVERVRRLGDTTHFSLGPCSVAPHDVSSFLSDSLVRCHVVA